MLSIWVLAVMMPGPDMFLVIRSAIKKNKFYALSAGYGIVVGTLVWLIVGFFLIGILSKTSFFQWVQLFGGAYLLYMAYKIFCSLFQKEEKKLEDDEDFAYDDDFEEDEINDDCDDDDNCSGCCSNCKGC